MICDYNTLRRHVTNIRSMIERGKFIAFEEKIYWLVNISTKSEQTPLKKNEVFLWVAQLFVYLIFRLNFKKLRCN